MKLTGYNATTELQMEHLESLEEKLMEEAIEDGMLQPLGDDDYPLLDDDYPEYKGESNDDDNDVVDALTPLKNELQYVEEMGDVEELEMEIEDIEEEIEGTFVVRGLCLCVCVW